MSLMSWNYQGLENFRSVKTMKKEINKEKPTIVFLMETKSNREWMNNVKDKCNMKHGLIIPSEGRSSGLTLMWTDIDVEGRYNNGGSKVFSIPY